MSIKEQLEQLGFEESSESSSFIITSNYYMVSSDINNEELNAIENIGEIDWSEKTFHAADKYI